MTTRERTILTPDAQIRLTDTGGHGMPLLLLHGGSTSRRVFDRQFASQLAERHRLIALDLPGNGDSSDSANPASGYTLPGFAATVAHVLAELEVTRFAVFGWSLGGHIAIEMLSRMQAIAGIMVMGAPPISRGPVAMLRGFHASWDMLLASKERFTPRDVERYAELCFGHDLPDGMLDAIRRADGRARMTVGRTMMRGDGADQRQTVETSLAPVALVTGEHDPIIRVGYLNTLNCTNLWDGKVHVLEGAGHAAFRDSADRFNALLMRFAADAEAWRLPLAEGSRRRA